MDCPGVKQTLSEKRSEEEAQAPKPIQSPFREKHQLHLHMLLLPSIFFGCLAGLLGLKQPLLFDGCKSDAPTNSLCFITDVLEKPIWNAYYSVLFLICCAILAFQRHPKKLKALLFYIHFLTAMTLRSFTIFCTSTESYSSLAIYPSKSPAKPVLLWVLVELWVWEWSYLGTYADTYHHEASRTIIDADKRIIHVFTSVPGQGVRHDPYEPRYLPWKDVAVRLSIIQLFDSLFHLIRLRYFLADGPYTSFVNNAELLTAILFLSLMLYTYARMKSHVALSHIALSCNGYIMGKETPICGGISARRSWSQDLIRREKILEHAECMRQLREGKIELRLPRPLVFSGEHAYTWYLFLSICFWVYTIELLARWSVLSWEGFGHWALTPLVFGTVRSVMEKPLGKKRRSSTGEAAEEESD